MSLKARLSRSVLATAAGPVSTLVLQLVNVPVFLRMWGQQRYGEWLLLSAFSTYLGLSDFGFGTVAGNDMTMRVAASDKEGALCTFQSTWVLTSAVSCGLVPVILVAAWLLPISRWLHISTLASSQVQTILLLQGIESLLILQISLQGAGYRADGRYPTAMISNNILRLAIGLSVFIALLFHASPECVACVTLITRATGTGLITWNLLRSTRWLRFGFRQATRARTRSLVSPAIAFLAFPTGNALTMEGTLFAIGVLLGPSSVALFGPTRTLARSAFQVVDSIKNAVWPELSAAYGAGDYALARKVHRYACQASIYSALVCVIVLWLGGSYIFALWTHGSMSLDPPTYHVLLVSILISAWWNTSSAVPMAANLHHRIALNYIGATAASLLFSFCLIPLFALKGAALALLTADVWMTTQVMTDSIAILHDKRRSFLMSLLDLRSIRSVTRGWRLGP